MNMPEDESLQAGVAQLRSGVRILASLHGGEWVCVTAAALSLAYLLYGVLSPNPLPDGLWNPVLARLLGLASGLGYAAFNLLHLALYSGFEDRLTQASSDVDNHYAEQGFAEVPEDITELVGRYRRTLDPVFLQARRGLKINAAAGGIWSVIALGLSYAAR